MKRFHSRRFLLPLALLCVTACLPTASRAGEPPTLTIMPLHNRAGKAYAPLVSAITLAAAGEVQTSGKAVVVTRDHLVPVVDEQALVEAGLVQRTVADWPLVPADTLVFGYVDVVDGHLVVLAYLVPAEHSDANRFDSLEPGEYDSVEVRVALDEAPSAVSAFAQALRHALPEAERPRVEERGEVIDKQAVAIFDLTGPKAPQRPADSGTLLADALTQRLSNHLPWQSVDRAHIAHVLAEQELAASGLSDHGTALMIGRLVGADHLIVGSVVVGDNAPRVDLHLLDTATGVLVAHASTRATDDLPATADALLGRLAEHMPIGRADVTAAAERAGEPHPEAVTLAYYAYELYRRGWGISAAARQPRARRLLRAALRLAPDHPSVHFAAGNVANFEGDKSTALHHFTQSVALAPDEAWFAFRLGMHLRIDQEDLAAALPYLQQASEQFLIEGEWNRYCRNARQLALVLRDLGRPEEALALFEAIPEWVRFSEDRGRAWRGQGDVLRVLERHEEAGDAYFAGGQADPRHMPVYYRLARQEYEKAGLIDKAMRMRLFELGQNRDMAIRPLLDLLEHLVDDDPLLASQIAYGHRSRTASRQSARRFQAILDRANMPPAAPPQTGAVFDLQAMCHQDTSISIHTFGTFRHRAALPYLKAHMEDVFGLPVDLIDDPESLIPRTYNRSRDQYMLDANYFRRLRELRQAVGANISIGLMSERGHLFSMRTSSDRIGIVATGMFDQLAQRKAATDRPLTAQSYSHFYPQVMKVAAMSLVHDPDEPDKTNCLTHSCIGRSWNWVSYHLRLSEPTPCAYARRRMRQQQPGWPAGPDAREPIVAGPRTPAVSDATGHVRLVVVGAQIDAIHARHAAHAVRMSTGIPVRVSRHPIAPDWQRFDNGSLNHTDLAAWARATFAEDPDCVAIALVVNDNVRTTSPRWLPWILEPPAPHETSTTPTTPVITIALHRGREGRAFLPMRLRQLESVTDPDHPDADFRAPYYAKSIVAGLVAAAHPEPCWTYGCPATLWEYIGDHGRCSYWLGPQCRTQLNKAFGR